MDRTARNGHAVRVLALLAVLLGLLAMHGLASDHHAAAAAGHVAAPAVSPDWAAHRQGADHHAADTAGAVQQPTRSLAAPDDRSCDSDCPGALVTLCVAVLAAVAALAAASVLLRRRRSARAAAAAGALPVSAAARAALPPPDPVRELCGRRT